MSFLSFNSSTASLDPGTKSAIKYLYRENSTTGWVTQIPDCVQNLGAGMEDFALVVRQEVNPKDRSTLVLQSVEVQSPFLRKVMQDTFAGFRGIAAQLTALTFTKPFHEFVYRWEQYNERIASETDEIARNHIKLFNSVIEPEILPHLKHRKELYEHQVVSYENLWMLFEPDALTHTQIERHDRILQVLDTKYEQQGFKLNCRCINYNGDGFGYEALAIQISQFDGYRSVHELGTIPLSHHKQRQDLEARLLERGRLFESYKGYHYMAYSGFLQYATPPQGWQTHYIDRGRIVVDANLFSIQNQAYAPKLLPLEDNVGSKSTVPSSAPSVQTLGYQAPPVVREAPLSGRRRRPAVGSANQAVYNSNEDAAILPDMLSKEHHYLLCTPSVMGYCFTAKRWARFFVNQIAPIHWNDHAFKRLVLPGDYKELILAFVNSHMAQEAAFDDLIEGKGRGMILLLHGEPGVGKTLTAEAVSEEMRKPLYSMSAGELGWDATSVEGTLQNVLQICTKWKCVLLIDECDIFLEQRSISDLERNKLVSVFLRMLEYYEGILFLTTNRVTTFDLAFKSRIDLNITYPSLDFNAKKYIWQTFATASDDFPQNTSTLTGGDLDDLAELSLNGRQIKNVVKAGRLLAAGKKEVLGIQHLRTALRVHNNTSETQD